jgi:hypothetical protein
MHYVCYIDELAFSLAPFFGRILKTAQLSTQTLVVKLAHRPVRTRPGEIPNAGENGAIFHVHRMKCRC